MECIFKNYTKQKCWWRWVKSKQAVDVYWRGIWYEWQVCFSNFFLLFICIEYFDLSVFDVGIFTELKLVDILDFCFNFNFYISFG